MCPCASRHVVVVDDAAAAGRNSSADAAHCAPGSEVRYGQCAPCAIGMFGGGAQACRPCPAAKPRTYHARLGAATLAECAVACSSGESDDDGHCPPPRRELLSPRACVFFVALTMTLFAATEQVNFIVAAVRRAREQRLS